MHGCQAAGVAPIWRGEIVADPQTVATAIRIGNPASWNGAVRARDESGGSITAVTDAEILDAYSFLARCEGGFCEPASAAAVAGLRKLLTSGTKPSPVGCGLPGDGMKDPCRAIAVAPAIAEGIGGGGAAANARAGEPLAKRALLRIASEVEGHSESVAAALYGAFTIALPSADGRIAARFAFPSAWRVCLFVPTAELPTGQSRAVLPKDVSRTDAVFNLAHASALLAAILKADGALLSVAMRDRLHEAARMKLVPALEEIVSAARDAGAFGAALSGAGPSVIAFP